MPICARLRVYVSVSAYIGMCAGVCAFCVCGHTCLSERVHVYVLACVCGWKGGLSVGLCLCSCMSLWRSDGSLKRKQQQRRWTLSSESTIQNDLCIPISTASLFQFLISCKWLSLRKDTTELVVRYSSINDHLQPKECFWTGIYVVG